MSGAGLRLNEKNKYRAYWEIANGVAAVESTPASIQFARSNTCNFKCVYCIDHRPGNNIPRNKIGQTAWEGMLGLIPRSAELGFHGISEFFIDPEFFDLVRRSAEAGAALSLNTNGSVCTQRHLDALAQYPAPISITFSLDAATPETFLRIRGQDFWHIVRNVRSYVECFAQRRDRTLICLSFVINRTSVKEMTPFVYLGKSLNMDTITFFRMHEYPGLDWLAPTADGGVFNYLDECTGNFREDYNRELERARRAAEVLGLAVDLPAPEPVEAAG